VRRNSLGVDKNYDLDSFQELASSVLDSRDQKLSRETVNEHFVLKEGDSPMTQSENSNDYDLLLDCRFEKVHPS
jgi:hypothetical protein